MIERGDFAGRETDENRIADAAEAVERMREVVNNLWRSAVVPAAEAIQRADRLERECKTLRESLAVRATAEHAEAAKLGVDLHELRAWLKSHGRATRADKTRVVSWLRTLLAIVEGGAEQ